MPVVRIQHIGQAEFKGGFDQFITEAKFKELKRHDVIPDDLVFAKLGDPVGRSALIPNSIQRGVIVADCVRLRIDRRKALPEYLVWAVNSPEVLNQVGGAAKGSTRQRANLSDFRGFKVPLPDLPEQKRIAGLLEQADRLRRTRRYALELSATFLPAAFLQLFGDPKTNPKNWPSVALVEVCDPKQWPTISGDELTERGYPVYGANGVIGCYTEYNHERPTVLLTCRGATCGTINVSTPKSYVTGNAMCLDEPDASKLTIEYLAWVLRIRGVDDAITGSAQPQITRQTLEKVRFPLPPLNLQHHFAALVVQNERLRATKREALRQAEHLFQSLLHRAFTTGL